MSGIRAEVREAGCRIPGCQIGGEFITLNNQKRLPTHCCPISNTRKVILDRNDPDPFVSPRLTVQERGSASSDSYCADF